MKCTRVSLSLHINPLMGRRRYGRFGFFGTMPDGVSVRVPYATGSTVVAKHNADTVSTCGGLRLSSILSLVQSVRATQLYIRTTMVYCVHSKRNYFNVIAGR